MKLRLPLCCITSSGTVRGEIRYPNYKQLNKRANVFLLIVTRKRAKDFYLVKSVYYNL